MTVTTWESLHDSHYMTVTTWQSLHESHYMTVITWESLHDSTVQIFPKYLFSYCPVSSALCSCQPHLPVCPPTPVCSKSTIDHTRVYRVIWEKYYRSGHLAGWVTPGEYLNIYKQAVGQGALGLILWSIKYKNVKLHKLSYSLQFPSKGAVNCFVYS